MLGDVIEVDRMGAVCGTNGGEISVYIILMVKHEDKKLLCRHSTRGMVSLKWTLNRTCGRGLDYPGSEQGQVAGCCVNGSELVGSINSKCLTRCETGSFSRRVLQYVVI